MRTKSQDHVRRSIGFCKVYEHELQFSSTASCLLMSELSHEYIALEVRANLRHRDAPVRSWQRRMLQRLPMS